MFFQKKGECSCGQQVAACEGQHGCIRQHPSVSYQEATKQKTNTKCHITETTRSQQPKRSRFWVVHIAEL